MVKSHETFPLLTHFLFESRKCGNFHLVSALCQSFTSLVTRILAGKVGESELLHLTLGT